MSTVPKASIDASAPAWHAKENLLESNPDPPPQDEKNRQSNPPRTSYALLVLFYMQILLLGAAEYIVSLETSLHGSHVDPWLSFV